LPTISENGSQKQLQTTLSEGLPGWWGKERSRILASSICVKLNGKIIPHEFDPATRQLTAAIGASGNSVIEIHFANYLGNHNWPQRFEMNADDLSDLTVRALGPAPATMPSRSTTRQRPGS
jgi:hypothetical protein